MSYQQIVWDDVEVGNAVPEQRVPITVELVVSSAASTLTYFGGHIDPDYAREKQGRATIYMATGPILGLIDRFVTSWAGPEAFIAKRSMRMSDSLYAGDLACFNGVVAAKRVDESRGYVRHLLGIDVEIHDAAGRACVRASVELDMPSRADLRGDV